MFREMFHVTFPLLPPTEASDEDSIIAGLLPDEVTSIAASPILSQHRERTLSTLSAPHSPRHVLAPPTSKMEENPVDSPGVAESSSVLLPNVVVTSDSTDGSLPPALNDVDICVKKVSDNICFILY